MPVVMHTGWNGFPAGRVLQWEHPMYLEDVIMDFPEIKIVMAHLGFQWADEPCGSWRGSPNLYGDLAFWDESVPLWRSRPGLQLGEASSACSTGSSGVPTIRSWPSSPAWRCSRRFRSSRSATSSSPSSPTRTWRATSAAPPPGSSAWSRTRRPPDGLRLTSQPAKRTSTTKGNSPP